MFIRFLLTLLTVFKNELLSMYDRIRYRNNHSGAVLRCTCVKPCVHTDNCFVPTSEIIAVEETELNKKQRSIGKWQKMAKPHAFTGKARRSLRGTR